jgi:predicted amidohydrolase
VRFKIEGIEDVNRNLQHSLIVPGWNNFNNGIFDYRREGDMIVGEHVFPISEPSTYLGRIEPCEMRLVFRFNPQGKVWWDEIRLEECEPVAPRLVKIAVSVGKRGSSIDGWAAFLDDAGQRKCDIALMTEYFVPGTCEMDSPAMKMMAEKAKEWNMYVSGSIVLQRGDVVYNSAPLFDREGKLVGIFDKLNLYDPELDQGISPGESVPVFETDFGNVGIMICYDSWHPAVAKLLALKGAEVILCPNVGYYMQIMHARAADNGVVVAVTSSDGPCGVWDAGGHRADGGSPDSSRRGPTQIVAFEENENKDAQFVTVDLSIEASPHYWGGPMLSSPGGRRVRATGNFYLEDDIVREVRRWETTPPPVTP